MLTGQDTPEFAWAVEMPLLTNRFFLYHGLNRTSILTVLEMFGWIIAGITGLEEMAA